MDGPWVDYLTEPCLTSGSILRKRFSRQECAAYQPSDHGSKYCQLKDHSARILMSISFRHGSHELLLGKATCSHKAFHCPNGVHHDQPQQLNGLVNSQAMQDSVVKGTTSHGFLVL